MSREPDYRELEPVERRIALMHVAGAQPAVIAYVLEMQPGYIEAVLARPRVARFALLVHGVASDSLSDGVKDLNAAFKAKATRAFSLQCESLEQMADFVKDDDLKPQTRVRAAMGVTFSARDILDRAGYRAPTKVYNYGQGSITPEAAVALADAARELRALRESEKSDVVDVTPRGEPHVELPGPPLSSTEDYDPECSSDEDGHAGS